VQRLATFRWRTPEPTSVDEELVLFDDDSAWLVVRGSRTLGPAVGTYRSTPNEADRRALIAAGPAPVDFDLLQPARDPAEIALRELADRVGSSARETPEAIATFHAQARGATADGLLALALLVVAAGTRAVQFELDPARSSIHFSQNGRPIGWADLPELPAGFATPDAVALGGVRERAVVEPGAYGALAFEVGATTAAGAVSLRVAGWLSDALPDDPLPWPFSLMTEDAPLEA
jgi:hypothetical protein